MKTTRRKRPEPKSPEQILADRRKARAPDFGAVGMNPSQATLERNDDIEITRSGEARSKRQVNADSARRLDAFEALKEGMGKGSYDAARRLERDLLIRAGLAESGPHLIRVDQSPNAKGRTDRMLEAGDRVEDVRKLLSLRDYTLMSLLVYAHVGSQFTHWRGVVLHCTKEDNANAQGAAVRAVCANLAEIYEKLDGVVRKVA